MKKCVSLILLITMLFNSSAAYAGEIQEEPVQYGYILCDEKIDNEIIKLDVMIRNGNLYVNAMQFTKVSGCAVEVTDEYIYLDSPHRVEVYFYHGSRKVDYKPPFLDWVFEYEAPFESICENGMGWIPLEYTLLILNEQWRVIKDTLYIEEHSKSILDEFSDMKMSEEYGYFSTTPYTLFKDNEKLMDKVAAAAHAANLFNGLISLEPNSWGNIFTGALFQSDYFIDMKYGDKITKMLCITSEEENDEMLDNIGIVYDIASSEGTFGSILSNMDTALDSKVDYAMKRLERVRSEFKKGNLSEYCLNKASQELDIAMDAQERFLKTGGIVLNVQNGLTELSPKLQIADQTFTGLEILSGIIEISGYATEFCSRDKFVAKALDTYIHHKSENGGISGGFDRAMVVQKDALNSNIAAYSAYEFFKSHFVDCADRLFQWGNPIWLELQLSQFAWSFISSHIPFFSEGLKETDSFETALYATALENDARNAFEEFKNFISKSEKNITSENLYKLVQLAYVYLKTSDVVQNATVAAFRDFSEENTEVINKHCRIIAKKIAALKKVEQYYGQENFGLVFGFLPECNKAYLEKYDPNVFRNLVYEVNESPLDRTFILPESNSRVYKEEELRALSKEQLELARNEIFARRGRIFKREDLQQYFEGKFWYLPCIEPDEFDDQTMLSDIEKKNLDLINGIENGSISGNCIEISSYLNDMILFAEAVGMHKDYEYHLETGYNNIGYSMNSVDLNIFSLAGDEFFMDNSNENISVFGIVIGDDIETVYSKLSKYGSSFNDYVCYNGRVYLFSPHRSGDGKLKGWILADSHSIGNLDDVLINILMLENQCDDELLGWQEAYLTYIKQNGLREEILDYDTFSSTFDYYECKLVCINDDEVPELVLGNRVVSYIDGKCEEIYVNSDCLFYKEKENYLYTSSGMHNLCMDEFFKIGDHGFEEVHQGGCSSNGDGSYIYFFDGVELSEEDYYEFRENYYKDDAMRIMTSSMDSAESVVAQILNIGH